MGNKMYPTNSEKIIGKSLLLYTHFGVKNPQEVEFDWYLQLANIQLIAHVYNDATLCYGYQISNIWYEICKIYEKYAYKY